MNPIGKMFRDINRKQNEVLNILCFPTHERIQTQMSKTGHNFYAIQGPGIKGWNSKFAPVPKNFTLFNFNQQTNQPMIPPHMDFDLIISENKFGQFDVAKQIAHYFHIPLVSLEHTLPMANWPQQQLDNMKNMRGNINLFISEYSRAAWGWKEDEAEVIHHGIDTGTFSPGENMKKDPVVLSVVNDWINRDHCCGYSLWRQVLAGPNKFETRVVGDTPTLSKAAENIQELVKFYRTSQVFLNTSTVSPIPTSLLESMSVGIAPVSTANCMIPEIIENGVNGFISNDPKQLNEYVSLLLKDQTLRERIGIAARQTVLDKFSEEKYLAKWQDVLNRAVRIVYH